MECSHTPPAFPNLGRFLALPVASEPSLNPWTSDVAAACPSPLRMGIEVKYRFNNVHLENQKHYGSPATLMSPSFGSDRRRRRLRLG